MSGAESRKNSKLYLGGFRTRENLEFSQNAIEKRLANLERRLERAEKKN